METLKFDLSKKGGKFKILNATNGGPALACHLPWAEDFLCKMSKRQVEMDFFRGTFMAQSR